MSSSTLPLELIYAIIDELAGDKPALSACSLTSSSLREQAQKHLFSEIVLRLDATDSSRADNLHEVLYSNPQLASFVVSLDVNIIRQLGRHIPLLNSFPRVRSVMLTTSNGSGAKWGDMKLNFREALLTLIQQSTVEILILDRQWSFPAEILSRCWQLKDLTVRSCQLRGLRDQPRMSTEIGRRSHSRQHGHLGSLKLDIASGLLLTSLIHPTSSLSFSRLHTLDISAVRPERTHALQKILDMASSSLMQLSLRLQGTRPNPAGPANPIISLRALTCLKSLVLSSAARYYPGQAGQFSSIISSLPTAVYGVNTHITFTLRDRFAFPAAYPEWSLMDTTLAAMHTAEVLTPLRVILSTFEERKQVLAALQRTLPDLDARRCFSVERHTRSVYASPRSVYASPLP